MTAPLRLGLVGLGRWGTRYLQTIQGIPECRLAAVVTGRPPPAGLDADCEVFARWPEMVARLPSLDGVVLAVPPAQHRSLVEPCIEAGVPVLVEKPMATSVGDAEAMAAVAHRSGIPLMVDHTHLFSSAFESLRRHVGPGPLTIQGVGGADGPLGRSVAPLWDWGPHDVAMALDLTGRPPVDVAATHQAGAGGRTLSRLTLRFGRGDVASLVVGNAMARKTRLFVVDDGEQRLVYDDLAAHKLTSDRDGVVTVLAISDEQPLQRVVNEFLRTIRKGGIHPSTSLGVDVVRVLEAAHGSSPP